MDKWQEDELNQLREDLEPTPTRIIVDGNKAICVMPFITDGNICMGSFNLIFTKDNGK